MIYAPTRHGRAAMFREAREKAMAAGDAGMVRAMDVELGILGFETTEEPQDLEQAVPRKPGRKPKPRCEHNIIVPRCPECFPEEQWPAA